MNVKFNKNFIKDLTGVDHINNSHISSIVGFYVYAIDNSDIDENNCHVFFKTRSEFINIDNKFNKLLTNLYTDSSESINQGINFNKLIYTYEAIHDNEYINILDNEVLFNTDNIINNNSLITLNDFKTALGSNFRVAFEIYNKANDNILTGLTSYEGFRPIIDIHNLKIFTNLISVTIPKNSMNHGHDLGIVNSISPSTLNSEYYKNYSVNSLIKFINNNNKLQIEFQEPCYEDWNLINLDL